MKRILIIPVAAAALIPAAAQAGGLLADTFVRPFCSECANKADSWNAKHGHVVDHAAAAIAGAAADSVVPGSGPVVTGSIEAGAAK